MSRSQRRLRVYRGFDEGGATAYMRGDFTSPPLTMKQQRDASIANRGGKPTAANTVAPAFTGTLTVGQTQTNTVGTWEGSGTVTFTRAWFRCGTATGAPIAIPGANTGTYVLQAADVGFFIRCRVQATDNNGTTTLFTAARGPVV